MRSCSIQDRGALACSTSAFDWRWLMAVEKPMQYAVLRTSLSIVVGMQINRLTAKLFVAAYWRR